MTTYTCPQCTTLNFHPHPCYLCGVYQAVPIKTLPAIPPECWHDATITHDYMAAVRDMSRGVR